MRKKRNKKINYAKEIEKELSKILSPEKLAHWWITSNPHCGCLSPAAYYISINPRRLFKLVQNMVSLNFRDK